MELLSNLGQLITNYAPLLGRVISNPTQSIGSLLKILSGEFKSLPGDIGDLISKIQTTPEAATKLSEIESNLKIELQRMILRQSELEIEDVQDARKQQIELIKSSKKDAIHTLLAIGISLQFFGVIVILMMMNLNLPNRDFLYVLTGQLAGAFTTVVTFYFGSSYKKNN